MKKSLIILTTLAIVLSACEKITNPVPKSGSSAIDWSLYPEGDSTHYMQNYWPEFEANSNSDRNVLIENFSGHRCYNCVAVDALIHSISSGNSNRVFDVSIHSGPNGMTLFQETDIMGGFTEEYYNPEAFAIGNFLSGISPGFIAIPRLSTNRRIYNGDITMLPSSVNACANEVLADELKVNIQTQHNYFASTRGLFVHTEVDKLDQSLAHDLTLVTYVVEDSMVSPQSDQAGIIIPNYVHRNNLRACIDGEALGHVLLPTDLEANGKYYYFSSFHVPLDLNIDNLHLIIYVYDATTHEILQVIKHEL